MFLVSLCPLNNAMTKTCNTIRGFYMIYPNSCNRCKRKKKQEKVKDNHHPREPTNSLESMR